MHHNSRSRLLCGQPSLSQYGPLRQIFTVAEKRAAKQKRCLENASLQSCAPGHLSRRSKKQRPDLHPAPAPPVIPEALITLAEEQIAKTRAFLSAFKGYFGDFTHDELEKCNKPPPYDVPSTWDDPTYRNDEHLYDILHGWQSREQELFETTRVRMYNTTPHEILLGAFFPC
ncbi:hypothetical protein BD779DRAFT_1679268 [Infundibulicybe gibba]|nr:hypothetical protein BD779DRAFT_1679268 [Infundibulicybe gibba]